LIPEGYYRWRIEAVADQRTQAHKWGKFEGLPNPQISMKLVAVARGEYEVEEDGDGNMVGHLTGETALDPSPEIWKRFNLPLVGEDREAQPSRKGTDVLEKLYRVLQGSAIPSILNESPAGGGAPRYEVDAFAAAKTLQGLDFVTSLFHSTWNDKDTNTFKGAREATTNNFQTAFPTTINVRRPQR
jgi:hypothetical protein